MADRTPPAHALFDELAEHLASGVVVYVATADQSRTPEAMFAMGATMDCERGVLTVYLAAPTRERTLQNLDRDPRVAITMSRPSDHKCLQVKGNAVGVRASSEVDRQAQAVHRAALVEQFAGIGIPRTVTRRVVWWPSVAVDVEVGEVFSQSPGPRAGERIAEL